MKITLRVTAGPHAGRTFAFDARDTFLVGRSRDAHLAMPADDPYFSRRHFLLELDPPRCRLTDLGSRNGTRLNGRRVESADVADGDEVAAGHTAFVVYVEGAETPTMDLPPADVFGSTDDYRPPLRVPGYRVENEIGRGGMGIVYRGVRERDGLPVALKTLRPDASATPRDVERFLRECRIHEMLEHAHVVPFLDAGEADGVIFLAMGLVNGPDLTTWLRGRNTDVATAVRIMCHVLAGMHHAHEAGFVHRDVKPSNILIAGEGVKKRAMLADFGLARAYGESRLSGLTLPGDIGGTAAFMPPEQVTHYRDVGPAADQYAAAATLYFALTGRPVLELPKELSARIAAIVNAEPVPITRHRADLPPGLAEAIHRALSREPGERFADAGAFRRELKRFA